MTCGCSIFIFPTGEHGVCDIKRIHNWCSIGTGEFQPEGPSFQWIDKACRVSHWTVDPRVGIFSVSTEHQYSIIFLTYHLFTFGMYCVVFVGGVTVWNVVKKKSTFSQKSSDLVCENLITSLDDR